MEREGYAAESFFRFLAGSGPFFVHLQVCVVLRPKINIILIIAVVNIVKIVCRRVTETQRAEPDSNQDPPADGWPGKGGEEGDRSRKKVQKGYFQLFHSRQVVEVGCCLWH